MKGINYNKLKRFDIGTKPTNPGYQTNTSVVDTSSFASTPGYDMSGDVQAQQNKWMPTVLSGAQNLGNVAMNIAKNYTTESAAAANGTKAGMNAAGKAAGIIGSIYGTGSMIKDFVDFSDRLKGTDMQNMSSESWQSKYGVGYKTYNGFNQKQVDDYTDAQNKAGIWSSTLNGMSAGASFGSLFSYLGTAIGGVAGGLTGLVGGLIGGSSRKRKIEESKNNVLGTQLGFNTQSEGAAASEGKRRQFYENADGGKTPGQPLGGNGYGMIQTPSGPTYGKIEGLASPDEGQIDMTTGETQYNGSKNMNVRDRRADVVPVGITGYANGGAFDQNVGIPGHQMDINGRTFADNARPFFKENEQLKDASRAIAIQREQNDSHKTRNKATHDYIANKLDKMQQKIELRKQDNAQAIADIVNRQTAVLDGNMYSCGKTPKYDDGTMPKMNLDFVKQAKPVSFIPSPFQTQLQLNKVPKSSYIEGLSDKVKIEPYKKNTTPGDIFNSVFGVTDLGVGPGWGVTSALPYLITRSARANGATPYAQNSFAPNFTAPAALNVLRSLKDNTGNKLSNLLTANRTGQYNIKNAGALSSGQRAALLSSNNLALAQAKNAVYDESNRINNGYLSQYAGSLLNYGQDSASRMQQANAYQQEAYRQAVASKYAMQEQADKNWFNVTQQGIRDYNTMKNALAMYNLYNRQLAIDEEGIRKGLA